MTEADRETDEVGEIVDELASACFNRSKRAGATAEGAKWLLIGSILYATAVAVNKRPDRLEDMAIVLHGALNREPRTLRRLMADIRKVATWN